MLHRWAAPALVLALCALVPEQAAGQTQSPGRKSVGGVGQNYPNPFNPETFFPLHIGHSPDHPAGVPDCSEDEGRQHVVSLKIYNVLAQLVAIPVLQASSGGGVSGAPPVNGLSLTCGDYTAWWNGHYLNTGREVASGVYMFQLVIDGQPSTRKMFVAK